MRKLIVGIALLLALLGGCQPVVPLNVTPAGATASLPAMTGADATPDAGSGESGPVHCEIEFEATVRQGPSSGVALTGSFDFRVDDSGALAGSLRQSDGGEIPAVGQVDGRAIHLAFALGAEQQVFGVGTALAELDNETCGTALGGPFVGPTPGDMGDWLARKLGANPSSVVPCDESCGD